MKQDIRDFSENELSLLVFNDENLYRMRNRSYFIDIIQDHFLYTDEQLDILLQDLNDDEAENA
jgi:hypothetical protein